MRDTDIFAALESEVRSYCRSFPATFVSARGATLTAEDGRTYLDLLAGAGVINYGHNDPAIVEAVIDYLTAGGIVQGLDLHTAAKRKFLEAFHDIVLAPRGLDYKVQFTGPTGSSAVEAALKLARKVTGRHSVIAFTNGYHGMSLGALSVTGNASKRRAASGLLSGVTRMPFDGYFGDGIDTLSLIGTLLDDPSSGVDKPAAMILETVQAEGGVKAASPQWLQGLAHLARRRGILLIVDDIQAGCGRTGPFFSFEDAGLTPDIVCLSKAIGGIGFPMALVLMVRDLDQWAPGEHIGTFRGNNLAFVAGTVALERFWRDPAFEREVRAKGAHMEEALLAIARNCPGTRPEVLGRGMLRGLSWEDCEIAERVSAAAFRRGAIVEACGARDQVLKLIPPLTISRAELDIGLAIVADSIAEVLGECATPQAVQLVS